MKMLPPSPLPCHHPCLDHPHMDESGKLAGRRQRGDWADIPRTFFATTTEGAIYTTTPPLPSLPPLAHPCRDCLATDAGADTGAGQADGGVAVDFAPSLQQHLLGHLDGALSETDGVSKVE